MRTSAVLLVTLLACGARPPDARHGKPTAPVEVRLDARAAAGGAYDVTLVATPTRDLPSLGLRLGSRRETFGAVRAGAPYTLTIRARAGQEVVGVAEAAGRTRAARIQPGAAPVRAPVRAPARIVNLPGLGGVAL